MKYKTPAICPMKMLTIGVSGSSKIILIFCCRQCNVYISFNDIGKRKKQKNYYFIFYPTGFKVKIHNKVIENKKFQVESETPGEDLGNGIKRQLYGCDDKMMMVKVKFEKNAVDITQPFSYAGNVCRTWYF